MEVGFQSADRAAHITWVKHFEEFLRQTVPHDVTQKTEVCLTQQSITQCEQPLRGLDSPHAGGEKETSPWEDTKAFLASFEQVAQACQWPREEWAAQLRPALSGEAEQAFNSLEARDREDYGKVKAAILCREANHTETLRQHFRQFRFLEVEDQRQICSQLQELCCQWLRPEKHSKEQILELLVLEQFLAIQPLELQRSIRAHSTEHCTQAVNLVEDCLSSHQEAEAPPDLKEDTTSLGEAEGTRLKATGKPIYWEVMGESCGNADSFGGLLVPKPEVFSEPGQEDIGYIQVCEDGVTFPGSISDYKEPSETGKKDPQKDNNEPEEVDRMQAEPSQYMIPGAVVIPKQECEQEPELKETIKTQNDSIRLVEDNSSTEQDPRNVWVKRLLYIQSPPNPGVSMQESPHMAEKPYGHPVNGQPILRRQCLKFSQQTCTGEKLHEYPECGKRLRSGRWVWEHQKIHTGGEKPFICSKCRKSFRWKSGWRRHQEAHV